MHYMKASYVSAINYWINQLRVRAVPVAGKSVKYKQKLVSQEKQNV